MRLKFLVLLLMIFALLFDVSLAAKDRKRNRNKNRNDDTTEDDEGRRGGSGLSVSEDKRKETKDKVMDLVERGEERKERHEKKEEESSEEKDKDEKEEKKNSTEIVIPSGRFRRHRNGDHLLERHRRQEHTLKKASEINDGQKTALDTKPKQDHQCGPDCQHRRRRHEHSLKKTSEINDGVQTNLDTKPNQDHQCGPTCKHNKRSADLEEIEIAKGVFLSEDQTPGTGLIRTRRAKGGKKDIGHRVATHPHTNKRTGIKAGRRRGQNAGPKDKEVKAKQNKKSRRALHLVTQDRVRAEDYARDFVEYESKGFYPKRHFKRSESIFPEDPDTKQTDRRVPNDEGIVVSADAGSISEY